MFRKGYTFLHQNPSPCETEKCVTTFPCSLPRLYQRESTSVICLLCMAKMGEYVEKSVKCKELSLPGEIQNFAREKLCMQWHTNTASS